MERLYTVYFDTQKNRVFSTWEVIIPETNRPNAIKAARALWDLTGHTAHMFHCGADRIEAVPEGREIEKFKRIDWRPVTWGNVRR